MADPLTIIGAASAVANIIDIAAKTISSLRDLHGRWKDADFTLVNLIAQLTSLKAALRKIQDWLDSDSSEQHHQLAMDFDVSIECCRMLIGKLDMDASDLHRNADDALTLGSKIKIVFGSKENENIQKMIERQIGALTLLLTACNCNAISDQKLLLEMSSSRKVFNRIRDDNSSLHVLRDTASVYSRLTDQLSKISVVFNFDRELFISKVYERALRGSLKEGLRRQQGDAVSRRTQFVASLSKQEMMEQNERSRAIDRLLAESERSSSRDCTILLMGTADCNREEVTSQLRALSNNDVQSDRLLQYTPTVRQAVLRMMRSITYDSHGLKAGLGGKDQGRIAILDKELGAIALIEDQIPPAITATLEKLWASQEFRDYITKRLIPGEPFLQSMPYFFKEIQRIASPEYIPIEDDIRKAGSCLNCMVETRLEMRSLNIRLLDVVGQNSERKKWIHQFDKVTSIIFMVNLSFYGQQTFKQTTLMEALVLFESVVNSAWFAKTSIILLLNLDGFKEMLADDWFKQQFPGYSGGYDDVKVAAHYILRQFVALNRAHLEIYPTIIARASDPSIGSSVLAAVHQSTLRANWNGLTS